MSSATKEPTDKVNITVTLLCCIKTHEFACVFTMRFCALPSGLPYLRATDATALKPTHEAGRRGGESIARGGVCMI